MIESLLYERDKERIAGYGRRIDELLSAEEEIIADLSGDIGDGDLSMIEIKLLQKESQAQQLLESIRRDMEGLSGEYLTATGVYLSTVQSIHDRLSGLSQALSDAALTYREAKTAGEAALSIERLKSLAEGARYRQRGTSATGSAFDRIQSGINYSL
mgnify:CR=1 FL=1